MRAALDGGSFPCNDGESRAFGRKKETQLVGEAEPLRSGWISLPFQNKVFISGKSEITKYKSIVPGRIQLPSDEGMVT